MTVRCLIIPKLSKNIRITEPRKRAVVNWTLGKKIILQIVACLSLITSGLAGAQNNALENVTFSSLPGNRVQIKLMLSGPAVEPLAFTIDNPARIALDFPGVANKLSSKNVTVGVGMARTLSAVEAKGRTRVVLNLVKLVPYETKLEGNAIYLTLEGADGASEQIAQNTIPSKTGAAMPVGVDAGRALKSIDFRRGKNGEGRVNIALTNPSIPIDVRDEGGKIVIDFLDTTLGSGLEKRLDVIDFATPVTYIDAVKQGANTRVVIQIEGAAEHLAYQSEGLFTIEVKKVVKEDQTAAKKQKFGYTGEKLSLNFQNIEVRAVLQLLADFAGMNLVTSDSVSGTVTLRLKSVPWDQALDIILKTKGLGMREMGNVILVAPSEEIAAREKQDLEAKQQLQELETLRSELVQINYAKAADIAKLLKAKENSMLSARGNVTVDERTNTLLVKDVAGKLEEIRKLVLELDIPIRQVLIESRIVIANSDFSRDLGVRFGGTTVQDNGDNGIIGVSGSQSGVDSMVDSAVNNLQSTGNRYPINLPSASDRLNVNLPIANTSAGRIALGLLGSDYLLDLELSAMQAEGQGEVVSSPRVITANQKEAVIEQGVEVPYLEASSSGAATVSFKKAVLSLTVTPQITPDARVIMDLRVSKDSVGQLFGVNQIPTINTREVTTQVLVDNGQTVVLGGIYEQNKTESNQKVPFFGDLPVLGTLFRSKSNVNNKEELLIFITPKILKENLIMH